MKILKLINNERKVRNYRSRKECGIDTCYELDTAFCEGISNDICKYDRGSCSNGINDFCQTMIDWDSCSSPSDLKLN